MLAPLVAALERWLFAHRAVTLAFLAIVTAVMGWFALQLKMDAGFEKQMPAGHEYVQTFLE